MKQKEFMPLSNFLQSILSQFFQQMESDLSKKSPGLITDEEQEKIAKIIQLTGLNLLMINEIPRETN